MQKGSFKTRESRKRLCHLKDVPRRLTQLSQRCSIDDADELDQDSVRLALTRAPNTLFLAATKHSVLKLNDMVEDISFQNSTPVATVPIAECAEPVSFFRGQRLVIMYNLRKRDGSVNGKFCTLLGVEG